MLASEREVGEAGLREAYVRLRSRLEDEEPGNPLVSVGEVLTWLFALKEYDGLTPPGSSTNEAVVHGLVFARHQVAHRLEKVAFLVAWPSQPHRGGISRSRIVGFNSELRWKPRADLQATQAHPALEPLYDKHVAGRPLLQPVEEAIAFLLPST